MSKYSFLIHDESGDYENITPSLRLRKFGAWLITEKIQQAKLAKAQARQILSAVDLAKRIAKDRGIEPEEAFNVLQTQDSPDSAMILVDYIDEARKFMDNSETRDEQESKIITIFMKTRAEGMIDGGWKKLSDWENEDTEMFDDILREKIVMFINSEQMGADAPVDPDDDEEDQPKEEDSEGNLPGGSEQNESAPESSKPKTTGTGVMRGSSRRA